MLKKTTMALVLSVLLLTVGSTAKAQLEMFTDRAAFGGDESADWGQLGACMAPIPNSFTATSNGGLVGISGNFSGTGAGQVRIQTSCGWGGNFAAGDILIWTNSPGQGPLTLTFDAPIVGAGTQIQADFFGPFTAQIEAFSDNTSLGSFTEDGVSSPAGDNSAIFIGVKDPDGTITSIVLSLTAAFKDPNDFAINKLSLDTGAKVSKPQGNQAASGASLTRH